MYTPYIHVYIYIVSVVSSLARACCSYAGPLTARATSRSHLARGISVALSPSLIFRLAHSAPRVPPRFHSLSLSRLPSVRLLCPHLCPALLLLSVPPSRSFPRFISVALSRISVPVCVVQSRPESASFSRALIASLRLRAKRSGILYTFLTIISSHYFHYIRIHPSFI